MNEYEVIIRKLCRKLGALDAMIERGDNSIYTNEDVRKILEEILTNK